MEEKPAWIKPGVIGFNVMLREKILFTQLERGYAQAQADDINRELDKFFSRLGAEQRGAS